VPREAEGAFVKNACIPALLFVTYTCSGQTPFNDEIPEPLLHGKLFRMAAIQTRAESTVAVCLVTDPNRPIVAAAETLADRIFSSIRVKIHWHEPPVCPATTENPIFMVIQMPTPEGYLPGALGAALPLEGGHGWVFYDRVRRSAPDDDHLLALLAHVMAHEIAHVLQGIIRHSGSGILKAQWSATDCARMSFFPLMFTSYDAILIHLGIEERRLRLSPNPFGRDAANRSDEILSAGEGAPAVP
jgi:hypothetical protein